MRELAETGVETSAVVEGEEKEQSKEHEEGGLPAKRHAQQSTGLF
jgi:hypothetical protein